MVVKELMNKDNEKAAVLPLVADDDGSGVYTAVVNLTAVMAHDRNYNYHPQKQIENLAASAGEFGYVRRIVVQEREGGGYTAVAGHGMADALRGKGYKNVEATIIPVDWPAWKILAYLVADNEHAKTAVVQDDALFAILKEVAIEGEAETLESVGISDDDLQAILDELGDGENAPKDTEAEMSRADELQKKWGTELGQLWRLPSRAEGREHRLICGDCTDIKIAGLVTGNEKVGGCLTSPPYNQGNTSGNLGSYRAKNEKLYDEYDDNLSGLDYENLIINSLGIIAAVMADEHVIIWSVSYNAKSRDDYGRLIFGDKNPFSVKETIVWDKGNALNIQHSGIYSRRCEFVFIMASCDKYLTTHEEGDGNTRWNYWMIPLEPQIDGHKATFPIQFAERGIMEFIPINAIVYDPFLGSGTTIIAAENLGRQCRAVELMPGYVAVALERYEQAFGITAELIPSAK